MKLKTLCLICAGLFSSSLLADHHDFDRQSFQLGYERLDIELDDRYEVQGNNFASATYGFKFTPYFGIELSALIPINNKETGTLFDTYRERTGEGFSVDSFSDIQTDTYTNSFEHDVMGNISLLLDLPVNDKFSFFANIGYSTGSVDVRGYDFVDNTPAVNLEDALVSGTECEITGIESECGQAIVEGITTYDGSGFSYGAGVRFSFVSNDNISIGYNSYLNTSDLEVSGWSVNYQWNF